MLHGTGGVGGESSFEEMLVLSASAQQLSSHPPVSLLFHLPPGSEAKRLKWNFAPVGSSCPSAPNVAELQPCDRSG